MNQAQEKAERGTRGAFDGRLDSLVRFTEEKACGLTGKVDNSIQVKRNTQERKMAITEKQLSAAWNKAKTEGMTNNQAVEEVKKAFPGINEMFVRFHFIVSAK